MVKLYMIMFMRMYDDDNVETKFFCYALNEKKAIERFKETTGYSKKCITDIYRLE